MGLSEKVNEIRLVLGDQLNFNHSWFEKKEDHIAYIFMEIKPESEYVIHHIQKIVAIFHAMRNFSSELEKEGHRVKYFKINDKENKQSFQENLKAIIQNYPIEIIRYMEPDEYRLDQLLSRVMDELGLEFEMVSTEHFLTNRMDLKEVFEGKKSYLMESFYRKMRKKHNILMSDDGEPEGGKWNYDHSNRKKLPKDHKVPNPFKFNHDVSPILEEINNAGLKYIGEIEKDKFIWPKDRNEALEMYQNFLDDLLENFGDYQDAMSKEHWSLYHSRISFALNVKMIGPREVILSAEEKWRRSKKKVDLSQTEGFIRQILGWREYMRGIYWAHMPSYKEENFFGHSRSLPEYYWTGETKMLCVKKAVKQSLNHAYAHHIQRLMVTGNFALLTGVDPDEVDQWYLGIYIDAFEWVEITNTRGMSQYADGGIVATKPYVSSGSYINKMSDYCSSCYYNHREKTSNKACPFNSLYWNFLDQHRKKLENNPRMGMMYRVWDKMDDNDQSRILEKAKSCLDHINDL